LRLLFFITVWFSATLESEFPNAQKTPFRIAGKPLSRCRMGYFTLRNKPFRNNAKTVIHGKNTLAVQQDLPTYNSNIIIHESFFHRESEEHGATEQATWTDRLVNATVVAAVIVVIHGLRREENKSGKTKLQLSQHFPAAPFKKRTCRR